MLSKIIIFGIIVYLCIFSNLCAQPYLFFLNQDTLTLEDNSLIKLDLNLNAELKFITIYGNSNLFFLTPSNDLIIVRPEFCEGTMIININDTTDVFEIPIESKYGCFGGGILFCPKSNKLYSVEGYNYKLNQLTSYDLSTFSIDSLFVFPESENKPKGNQEIFMSADENTLYFSVADTNYSPEVNDRDYIYYYSAVTNQVLQKRVLSSFGLENADGYLIHDGRKGKALVESFFRNQTKDSYYRLYDFDNDVASNNIFYQGYTTPYFTGDCNYLLLPRKIDSSFYKINTGELKIYSLKSGLLVKTIDLPPRGELYNFDSHPNNIYYVKDIELPTRQVWNLDMDSIFNVLDLTNINPNSVSINSNSFPLTVNGKGFDTLSTVYFNGQLKITTFISDSVLTAEILSSDVSVLGSFPVWVKDRYSISDTLQFNVTQSSNPNLVVNLKNSLGNQIPASNVQYYENNWKDAVNNGDGTFTVITTRPTVSIRVYYEYASLQADNVTAQNNTYTFTTVNAAVQLKNSLGNLIDVGTAQYYAGAWRTFGTTSNGVAYKELLPVNYSFRMTYEYSSINKQQNLSSDPTVVFQTVNAAVQLKNSSGNLIDQGTVQYYAGAWRSFGTTSNGVAYKELLPINYSFRMTYEYGSIDKQQNLSTDPTVVFQTVNAAVQLKNSLGSFIDIGTVQYYAGAWRSFGTTSNGVVYKELLPINYSFRMTYEYGSIDKQQNLSSDPTVLFQTVNAAVQLKNSLGNLIDLGTVQYYAGAWRTFGTTSNGVAYKELLPINYSFRMTYEFVSKDKQQNISTNPVVDFNTVLCSVKVSKTSNNQPINNAIVKYYAGAWRNLGTTNQSGIATKELIPSNISFRASFENVSLDKQQDISVNNLVEILLNVP